MNKTSKIAIAVTSAVAAGTLAFSLPALAHDMASGSAESMGHQSSLSSKQKSHSAELAATITSIPSTVTDVHEATKGANFELYKLVDGATTLPGVKPTIGLKLIDIHHDRSAEGEGVIAAGSFEGQVHFKGSNSEGVTRYALYPSDGSAAVLVTVTTDASGVSTAVASKALSVSYDAAVAANWSSNKSDSNQGKKHLGKRGKHSSERGNHDRGPRR